MKILGNLAPILLVFSLVACGINEPDEPVVKITGCASITVDGIPMERLYGVVSFSQSGTYKGKSYDYFIELSREGGCIRTAKATRR